MCVRFSYQLANSSGNLLPDNLRPIFQILFIRGKVCNCNEIKDHQKICVIDFLNNY